MIAFVGESDFGIGIHRNKYVKLKKKKYIEICAWMHMYMQLESWGVWSK